MNKEKEIEAKAYLLLYDEQKRKRLNAEADRPSTNLLFGLWLLLIIGLFIITGVTFWTTFGMVIITGAYTFQEVRRLHKRIDAMRKLNEMDHRTRPSNTPPKREPNADSSAVQGQRNGDRGRIEG